MIFNNNIEQGISCPRVSPLSHLGYGYLGRTSAQFMNRLQQKKRENEVLLTNWLQQNKREKEFMFMDWLQQNKGEKVVLLTNTLQ